MDSRVDLEICSLTGCFHVVSRVDQGLFEHQARGEVRGTDRRVRITNDTVEAWEDGAAVAVGVERAQSLRNWVMARVYFVFLPFRLNDDSVFKQDLGVEMWGDRGLHRVKVTFVPGSSSGADDEFVYWFDPESGRLEQFAYSFAGEPGGLRFRRAFNFRRVGGILFYDQENWGVEGDGLSVDDIDAESVAGWERISLVTLKNIRVVSVPGLQDAS